MDSLKTLAQKHHESVIALRRYFHAHPELSNEEFNTQKKIMEVLTELGLKPRPIFKTGVIADLKGGKPGRCVAIRADIDALNLQDECGKPYQSVNANACHACGHDGHMAMLLGVAKVLTDYKDELPGTIRFLFQPAEEKFPGGAKFLVQEGALDGVDAVIGAHLWQPVPAGCIGVKSGEFMAAPDEFDISIQGRGGHGSMPHQTVDALLVAAQISVALNTIVSRSIDPLEKAVVSLGYLHSGDTFNIIPDHADIKGTVRTFKKSVRDKIFERIEAITKGICESAGATYKIHVDESYPALINDEATINTFIEAGTEALGADKVLKVNATMGAEDFSYYLEKVPGAFIFVGDGNAEKGIIYPQHHPRYDMDEDALAGGVEVMARTAVKLASQTK